MHLEILWLKNNKIKKLPSGIGQLRKLRELSVSENALEVGSPSCVSVRNLHTQPCMWLVDS